MPVFAKYQWRSITFYSRLTPILWRCYRTKLRASKSIARGRRRKAAALWRARHEDESKRVIQLLLHMKGFYLKLGQVLASKGDILPPAYLRELSRLFGRVTHVRVHVHVHVRVRPSIHHATHTQA